MKKNLIQKIVIGVLAASTVSVSVAMAVILNTYVTVTLRAGEGSFENNQQNIVLQNVRPGSSLKTIRGYVLPSKNNDDYTFDNWVDENEDHKIVEQDAQINHSMVLIASYTYSTKYYREKYIKDINTEVKDYTDYAIMQQISSNFPSSIKTVANIGVKALNDSKSNFNINKIYDFTHSALNKLNRFDIVRDNKSNDSYEYITNVYKEDITYLQDNYIDEQLDVINTLNKNHLSANFIAPIDKNLTKNFYQDAIARTINTTTHYDLYVIKNIDGGLVRGSIYLDKQSKLESAIEAVNAKLDKAKNEIKDNEKLEKMIDFLGDYAATYCKCLYFEKPEALITELNSLCDQMLSLLINGGEFAEQKICMISALVKGDSYDILPSQMGIIEKENTLLKNIFATYTADKQINDITNIVLSAANTLKEASSYAYYCVDFIDSTLNLAISCYIEREDFLDCAIYAMSVPSIFEDTVLNEMYIKEGDGYAYQPTNNTFINYNRVYASLEKAFNLYKNFSIPDKNLKAFKALIKGIIDTSTYTQTENSGPTVTALDNFIAAITKAEIGQYFTGNKSTFALTGLSYALSGLAFAYVKLYNKDTSLMTDNILHNAIDSKIDSGLIREWFESISDKCVDNAPLLIGKTIYLNWKYTFLYFLLPPYVPNHSDFQKGFDAAYNNSQDWLSLVIDCVHMARDDQAFFALENALTITINSNRMYHYVLGYDDWANTERYNEINPRLIKELFGVILSSNTTAQFTKRLDIYTKEFADVVNRMNNETTFNNPTIDDLKAKAEKDMLKVE